ncbi:neutral zinc metallopeptidase [Chitinibacter tainanensis]|uniref:KPN_02809 family neutral zinc metallopeptidase n=1 Tax=Chitinibacter tainanensis TaxID=230667 RepID=UPI002354C6E6|nr:neutral zinc metallopeptidase [Chitinibacter tainanensis]
MRWDQMRESSNVEDQTGRSGAGLGRLSLGGVAVVVVIGLLLGKSPLEILGMVAQQQVHVPAAAPNAASQDPTAKQMVRHILGDTEATWQQIFAARGGQYHEPKLVYFSGAVQSACGSASAAMGPFYCPADQKVYIDLAFFRELSQRYAAPGDFAQAYVIAHEVGHHVQNLLGISAQVHARQQQLSKTAANQLSVRLELQADCLAGVWGHSAAQRGLLDPNDLDEALQAANAIGDDTLQHSAGRAVVPDAFTHGTSAQRMTWFRRGMQAGDLNHCNTFDPQVIL